MIRQSVLSKCFLFFFLIFFSSQLLAQDVRLSLNIKNKTIGYVLDAIELKTGFSYLVRSNDVNLNKQVSIRIENKSIAEVLAKLFEDSDVSFEIKGQNISIFKPQTNPIVASVEINFPIIQGKIIDINDEPLIGASVMVKGSKSGVVSGIDGRFSIRAEAKSTLVISYLGYFPVEVKTNNSNNFIVRLTESVSPLDEVVVTAFATQEKQQMTSSVTQIKAREIEDKPNPNISAALQGLVTGVNITQGSGQPGQLASLLIRGMGSIQSETSPLVIVDGVPSSLSMVSNNDVESISILKDAAACSVYGARAANGVILVTTKRGISGSMILNYSGYAGFQQPTEIFQEADAYHFANAYNTALMHDALTASTPASPANVTFNENKKILNESELEDWKSGRVPSTNWRRTLFNQPGFTQSHALNISGGTKNNDIIFRNSFSFNYLQQLGNVVNTDYDRYSMRENGEIKWNKFTVSLLTGMTLSHKNEPTSVAVGDLWQIISSINRQRPVDPIKTAEGEWNMTATNDTRNPIRQVYEGGKRTIDSYNVLANIKLSYELNHDVSVNFTNGLNYLLSSTDAFKNRLTWYNGTITGPNSSFKSNFSNIHQLQQLDLNIKKNLDDYHFKVLIGLQNEYHTYKYFDAFKQDFVINNSSSLQLGSPEGAKNNSAGYEWALLGLFGRLNFDYQNKYLFEINFREDFSSRLSVGSKSDFFPAFSAGWMLSDEPFMRNLKHVLSEFKLRASYGILGNQNIPGDNINSMYYPNKPIIAPISDQYYVFGNTIINALSLVQDPNTDFSWEHTTITDIAVDGKLWNGLITYNLGYFDKKTSGMLMTQKVSTVHGGKDFVTNLGAMKNYGVEFEFGYNRIKSNGFLYNLSGNVTYMTNRITDLGGLNLAATGVTRNVVGHSLNSFYLFQSNELLTKEEFVNTPGELLLNGQKWGDQKITDIAGAGTSTPDGKIDVNDKVLMNKSSTPRWFFGLNFNFSYKNFGLSGLLQGAADYYRYLGGSVGYGFNNGYSTTQWTIDNSYNPFTDENNYETRLPRLSVLNTINISYPSNRFLFNSSYVRLKNMQLYYVISDEKITNKLRIKNFKFYLSGVNLFTFSALPITLGVDPEISSATSGYPLSRVVTLGVNVNF